MTFRTASLVVALVLGFTQIATAEGFGEPKVTSRAAKSASLKVTEPTGFTLTVTTTAGNEVGTIPEVFTLPNKDQFVTVMITAPNGSTWKRKIEVSADTQTIIAVPYAASPNAAPATARRYLGTVMNRLIDCNEGYEIAVKIEFLVPDSGAVQATVQINKDSQKQVEIAGGTYDIRIWGWENGKWGHISTFPRLELPKADGWKRVYGCSSQKPSTVTWFTPAR